MVWLRQLACSHSHATHLYSIEANVLAIDLDGTLLYINRQLSPEVTPEIVETNTLHFQDVFSAQVEVIDTISAVLKAEDDDSSVQRVSFTDPAGYSCSVSSLYSPGGTKRGAVVVMNPGSKIDNQSGTKVEEIKTHLYFSRYISST